MTIATCLRFILLPEAPRQIIRCPRSVASRQRTSALRLETAAECSDTNHAMHIQLTERHQRFRTAGSAAPWFAFALAAAGCVVLAMLWRGAARQNAELEQRVGSAVTQQERYADALREEIARSRKLSTDLGVAQERVEGAGLGPKTEPEAPAQDAPRSSPAPAKSE